MNIKNLAMWVVIVILTIGLYNMFKTPQSAANQNSIPTKANHREAQQNIPKRMKAKQNKSKAW